MHVRYRTVANTLLAVVLLHFVLRSVFAAQYASGFILHRYKRVQVGAKFLLYFCNVPCVTVRGSQE
jgi:hypothetical protein